ncbi:tetratricopeptide repeat protein [Pleionea sediminis]|uniref:tetratricopeptide repeat protein n=1 Tax=Pleionea sediminis TaxID=2569479 RepID=UPI00118648BC|nr:hypothetical protein [Pleionea sediminis]
MENLDSEELLHLAMHASSQNRHDDAIQHLKTALSQDTNNAFVNYLLAAEYASIAFYDRALTYFETTAELAPDLHVARLQWGLLLTALDQIDKASLVLEPLVSLEEDNFYRQFANGLQLLIKEDLESSRDAIKKAISLNDENVPLNQDFEKIVKEIEARLSGDKQQAQTEEDGDDQDKSGVNSFLLSSYNN